MKRFLDILFSLVGSIVFFPIFVAVAGLILCTSGFPLFFTQARPGLHGKLFSVYKFRTMRVGNEADEVRLTAVGKFLRRTSLDELPQFFNVLRGEMSLVGPRPLLEEYLNLYSKRQAKRHDIKPGITGWSQINGRNAPNWDDRLEMDVWYVENQSLWLDFRIIFRTIAKVISGSGVNTAGNATVELFKGSKNT